MIRSRRYSSSTSRKNSLDSAIAPTVCGYAAQNLQDALSSANRFTLRRRALCWAARLSQPSCNGERDIAPAYLVRWILPGAGSKALASASVTSRPLWPDCDADQPRVQPDRECEISRGSNG